jgi:glutaminyl-peptide cyclotransferase
MVKTRTKAHGRGRVARAGSGGALRRAALAPAAVALAAAVAVSCSRPGGARGRGGFDPAAVSGERAMDEVQALIAIAPRDAATPGGLTAARHLLARLRAAGVRDAAIEEFREKTPDGILTFHNVVGRLPGRGQGLVILASHYDTKAGIPGFAGANDSGSSSGLLLELARAMVAGPVVDPEIRFAFFDGEECRRSYGTGDGLHGSRYMAERLSTASPRPDVRAVIVMDMIGDRDLRVSIPRNSSPEIISRVFEAAHAEGVRDRFTLDRGEMIDDHLPFFAAGFPAIDLIDFQFGSAPGRNDYWHTPQDSIDKIDARSLEIVGRVVVRVVNGLCAGGERP